VFSQSRVIGLKGVLQRSPSALQETPSPRRARWSSAYPAARNRVPAPPDSETENDPRRSHNRERGSRALDTLEVQIVRTPPRVLTNHSALDARKVDSRWALGCQPQAVRLTVLVPLPPSISQAASGSDSIHGDQVSEGTQREPGRLRGHQDTLEQHDEAEGFHAAAEGHLRPPVDSQR